MLGKENRRDSLGRMEMLEWWEEREEERETKEGMWGEAAEIKGQEKRLMTLEKNPGCPGDEEGTDNGPFSQNSLLNISGHIC